MVRAAQHDQAALKAPAHPTHQAQSWSTHRCSTWLWCRYCRPRAICRKVAHTCGGNGGAEAWHGMAWHGVKFVRAMSSCLQQPAGRLSRTQECPCTCTQSWLNSLQILSQLTSRPAPAPLPNTHLRFCEMHGVLGAVLDEGRQVAAPHQLLPPVQGRDSSQQAPQQPASLNSRLPRTLVQPAAGKGAHGSGSSGGSGGSSGSSATWPFSNGRLACTMHSLPWSQKDS